MLDDLPERLTARMHLPLPGARRSESWNPNSALADTWARSARRPPRGGRGNVASCPPAMVRATHAAAGIAGTSCGTNQSTGWDG